VIRLVPTILAIVVMIVALEPVHAQPSPSAPAPSSSSVAEPAAANAEAPARKVEKSGPHAVPGDLPETPRFVVVALHDEVTLGMASFVERVAETLQKDDIFVLDIRTFGGRVDAAVRIRDTVLHCRDRGAWAVAYVNPRAISAGALIAYATDVIVVAPGASMGATTPVQVGDDQKMQPVSEKVVSYMRSEMRSTAEARGRNGDVAEAMVDSDIAIEELSQAGKLLTLDGKQALAWGVASFEAGSTNALVEGLGYDPSQVVLTEVTSNWAERVAAWLSMPVFASLLMSIGMLALMVGLYSQNYTVVSIGAVCLLVFFFGHFVVRLAGVEDIALFAIGLTLIAYEVYAPGHIFPGTIGAACVVAALLMGLVDFGSIDFSVQWQAGYVTTALTTLFGAFLLTLVLTIGAFRMLPESKFAQRIMLQTSIDTRSGDRAHTKRSSLAGATGTAATELRPTGKVRIDNERYDAKAAHGFIERGERVKVQRHDGFELVVSKLIVEEDTAASAKSSADLETSSPEDSA